MPEWLWNVLALIGLGCVLSTMLLGVWMAVSGELAELPDEDATLDVQNHWGDSRPIR